PQALRETYPQLVVVAIRPFGGVGPRSAWKASDIELMAAGGAMALAGEPDGMPVRVSEPQSYGWAGAPAAIGSLVALFHRDATGRGDLVDVSAQASVVTALSLSPEQYQVLRRHGTEAPGSCALNCEKRLGTFACAGCGQPLFVSKKKFESGTGWPSFNDPVQGAVETSSDRSYGMVRTEVHCSRCG